MRAAAFANRTDHRRGTPPATAVGFCLSCLGWCFLWGQAAAGLHFVPPLVPAALFFGGLMLPGFGRSQTTHGVRS
ncbi:MAG TPA: hypothetical protein VHC42_10750 [Rhizomicrobium sp.]|nr:hypothetical protein [Rhizomicrobium sp.]